MLYTRHALMWPRQLDGSRLLVSERHILVLRLQGVTGRLYNEGFLVDRASGVFTDENFNKLI